MSTDTLCKLSNSPQTVTLGDKEFLVSAPSLRDLADAEAYGTGLKKARRIEQLKERLEFLQTLPKDLPAPDKKDLIEQFFPKEITALEKLNLMASLPDTLSEKQKFRRIALITMEKDVASYNETLFLLHRCVIKHQPSVTLDEIASIATLLDLTKVIEIISPKDDIEKND